MHTNTLLLEGIQQYWPEYGGTIHYATMGGLILADAPETSQLICLLHLHTNPLSRVLCQFEHYISNSINCYCYMHCYYYYYCRLLVCDTQRYNNKPEEVKYIRPQYDVKRSDWYQLFCRPFILNYFFSHVM